MRAANAGHRVGYDSPLSPRTLAFRTISALVASVVLLALLLPAAKGRRSDLYYRVESLFRPTYVPVPEQSLETPDQVPPKGFQTPGIASGEMQSPWVVGWSTLPAPASNGPCRSDGGPAAGPLLITFSRPANVDRVSIQAGLVRTDPRSSEMARPKNIDLWFDNNACVRLKLADQFTTQQFEVHVKGASDVVVNVIGVFPPTGHPLGATAITSVAFMRRR
jgi:hypothetical protein